MVVAFDTMYQLILTTPSHTINPLDLPLVGHICAFHTVSTFLLLGLPLFGLYVTFLTGVFLLVMHHFVFDFAIKVLHHWNLIFSGGALGSRIGN